MTDTRQPHEQQPYGGARQHLEGQQSPPAGYPAPTAYGQWAPPPRAAWGPQHLSQWGPPQQPPQWSAQPPAPPTNGLAMPALILGIITLGLSPLPILNQAGILVGLVGLGLGIPALIIGLRRRVRAVMATIGLALSILGLISSFAFTQSFVNSLDNIGSSGSSSPATPAQSVGGSDSSEAPAAPPTYTLSITGSARTTSVNWSVDGSSGSAGQSTPVPWTRTMNASNDSFHSVTLSAHTYLGTPGGLTCTITDQTGRVLDTKSAESQGGDYGSATVMCSAFGSGS